MCICPSSAKATVLRTFWVWLEDMVGFLEVKPMICGDAGVPDSHVSAYPTCSILLKWPCNFPVSAWLPEAHLICESPKNERGTFALQLLSFYGFTISEIPFKSQKLPRWVDLPFLISISKIQRKVNIFLTWNIAMVPSLISTLYPCALAPINSTHHPEKCFKMQIQSIPSSA